MLLLLVMLLLFARSVRNRAFGGGSMRLKREKERPTSAQPPKNSSQLASPVAQQPTLNLPNRAMSVSVRPQSSPKDQAQAIRPYLSMSQSVSKAYSNPSQRPPINPELHKLQQQPGGDWPGDGEGAWRVCVGVGGG